MQKKQTILVVASLLVVVLSVTLAYFTAQIIGKGKNVTINSADLKIIFTDTDGSISGTNIEPGKWNVTKTFTIENKSNETYKYNIVIQYLVNTFVTNGYLQYKITSTNGGYNMTEFKDVPKSSVTTDTILAYSASIDVGVTQTYTVEFIYKNDESVDQSDDMGKTLSGKLFITEGTKDFYAGYEEGTLGYKIMRDNLTRSTRTTFTAFTENTTGTLFTSTEQIGTNPVKDVYYYAGNTTNNWVKFGKITESSCSYKGKKVYYFDENDNAGNPENETECTSTNICNFGKYDYDYDYVVGLTESECKKGGKWITEKATWNGPSTKDIYWRIIRTNADESIKLLYAGTSLNTTSGYIGWSFFPSAGYKYGTTDSLENNRLNTNDSTIKTYVDNWYKNNFTAYTKYLSNDAVYCNDRNLLSVQTSTSNSFYYAPYKRIKNKQPTYNCTNMSDAFSVNNTSAKLDYPIALMTADEVAFAGGEESASLTEPYAWYYTNANGECITGDRWWWTFSPYGDPDDGKNFLVLTQDQSNYIGTLSSCHNCGDYPVRPSVSLKSCIKYSTGDGSATNPYTILETESGC